MMAIKTGSDAPVTRPNLRPYKTPELVTYGDARQLTQGGASNEPEVGNNNTNLMN